MSQLLSQLTARGAFPMLEKTLAFAEARNRVLAENVANITTPGYRTKQLSVGQFQKALQEAAERRDKTGARFELPATREFHQDAAGHLRLTPAVEPVENLLFHDGTNARIERQMSYLAENAMMHQAASELLKTYFDRLQTAIRGRVA